MKDPNRRPRKASTQLFFILLTAVVVLLHFRTKFNDYEAITPRAADAVTFVSEAKVTPVPSKDKSHSTTTKTKTKTKTETKTETMARTTSSQKQKEPSQHTETSKDDKHKQDSKATASEPKPKSKSKSKPKQDDGNGSIKTTDDVNKAQSSDPSQQTTTPVKEERKTRSTKEAVIQPTRPPLVVNPPVVNHNVSIAYITFVHLQDTKRFDTFVFPSIDTFLKNEPLPYFVVLNEQWKPQYAHLCSNHTVYCNKIHPIWVNCTEDYYGPSPCCKADQGLSQMFESFPDIDWFVYMDDDFYVRPDYTRNLLSTLDPEDPAIVTPSNLFPLGVSFFRDAYRCSRYEQDMHPWGNPVMYNRGAMQRIHRGLQLGAIQKQCEAYTVTHDAGNAVVHWMYSLPVLQVGVSVEFPSHFTDRLKMFNGKEMGVAMHKVTLDLSFREVEEMYNSMNSSQMVTFQYVWHNVTAFHQTDTYKKHGDPSTWTNKWHTMGIDECTVREQKRQQRTEWEKANTKAVAAYKKQSVSPSMAFITYKKFFPIDYSLEGSEEALGSWLRDGVYFSIMDSFESDMFYDEYCDRRDGMCDRVVPVWVDCPRQDYTSVCLIQEGLKSVATDHPDFDWYVLLDDHTFLRMEMLQTHLGALDPSEPLVVTVDRDRLIGFKTRRVRTAGSCDDVDENHYPTSSFLVYSRGAIERIMPSLQIGGLMIQADASEVMKTDVGAQVAVQTFNWMFSLPALVLPVSNSYPTVLFPDENTPRRYMWTEQDTLGILLSLNKPMAEHETYFNNIHSKTKSNRKEHRLPYVWNNATGFRNTGTYREHGDPMTWGDVWHNFTIEMCSAR